MKSFNRLRCLNKVVSDVIEKLGFSNIVVADIASDHGYLAELLSRNDKVKKVFATDISQKCLDKTNELKSRCNLDKVETKLGDGLTPICGCDLAVMAGIGGYEIIRILDNQNKLETGENKCNIFVFQPSKNPVELRMYLINQNIEIISDFIVFSGGRFYPIIVVNLMKKNDTEKTLFNLYFGKDNSLKSNDFLKFLNAQLEELKFIEKIDFEDIKISNDLKTKLELFNLVKRLIEKSKGE